MSAVTDVSRRIQVRSGAGGALTRLPFDDVDAVLVGGLERLSAPDVVWLDRFMRERGGSIVLVPDGRVDTSAWHTLIGSDVSVAETLLERPAPLLARSILPRLDASELLSFTSPNADTLAASGASGAGVVVSLPKGAGKLLLSGALDAWRYRAEPGVQFDRFWQTAIAGAAMAARSAVEIDVTPAILAPGETGRLTARVRRAAAGEALSARVIGGDAIRLWPAATTGEFTGTFSAPADTGAHAIRASAEGAPDSFATANFVVGQADRIMDGRQPPLALLATSHGGIDVDERHLATLETFIRAQMPASSAPARYQPVPIVVVALRVFGVPLRRMVAQAAERSALKV